MIAGDQRPITYLAGPTADNAAEEADVGPNDALGSGDGSDGGDSGSGNDDANEEGGSAEGDAGDDGGDDGDDDEGEALRLWAPFLLCRQLEFLPLIVGLFSTHPFPHR